MTFDRSILKKKFEEKDFKDIVKSIKDIIRENNIDRSPSPDIVVLGPGLPMSEEAKKEMFAETMNVDDIFGLNDSSPRIDK